MRRLVLLGVVLSAALARAQDVVRVTPAPFSTSNSFFRDVPGGALRLSAAPNELVLLLWRARLSTTGGPAELFLSGDGGARWGLGTASDVPAGSVVRWSSFDWDIGRDIAIFPQLRVLDGGTATVDGLEAVALRLGPSGLFRFQENTTNPALINDAQWSVLASATAPAGSSGQWLVLALATVELPNVQGVSLRLRVGMSEYPPRVASDERARFLTSGPGPRTFFYATPLTLMPNDLVAFEGTVNPRAVGPPTGATAELRDVRLLLIPQAALEQVDEVSPPMGFSVGGATQVVTGQLPRTILDGGWELLTFSAVLSGDGPTLEHELVTEPAMPPFASAETAVVTPDTEHPLLSTWVLRAVVPGGSQVTPQWWARSTGQLQGWASRAARWRPDAGAGVGLDASVVVPDAGLDAGVSETDAGLADAGGSLVDGGAAEEDGGVVRMRRLSVGCGASGAGSSSQWLALLLALRAMRRRSPGRARVTHA